MLFTMVTFTMMITEKRTQLRRFHGACETIAFIVCELFPGSGLFHSVRLGGDLGPGDSNSHFQNTFSFDGVGGPDWGASLSHAATGIRVSFIRNDTNSL